MDLLSSAIDAASSVAGAALSAVVGGEGGGPADAPAAPAPAPPLSEDTIRWAARGEGRRVVRVCGPGLTGSVAGRRPRPRGPEHGRAHCCCTPDPADRRRTPHLPPDPKAHRLPAVARRRTVRGGHALCCREPRPSQPAGRRRPPRARQRLTPAPLFSPLPGCSARCWPRTSQTTRPSRSAPQAPRSRRRPRPPAAAPPAAPPAARTRRPAAPTRPRSSS
jgi:hypothetical protein